VFLGSGRSVVDGKVFEWGSGDIFVVPTWRLPVHQGAGETFQPR
jgi:gentisate 1,2-dioxygenase